MKHLFRASTLAAAALALLLGPAAARDPDGAHLVPEFPVWNIAYAYDDTPIVMTVFKEAFADDVVLRLHVTTSMVFTEDMIAMKAHQGTYSLVVLRLKRWLLGYSKGARRDMGTDRLRPKDYRDVRPERCEIALPAPLAKRVAALWRAVLLETRYDTRRTRGSDGADYAFWQLDPDLGVLAGRIWSPDEGTKPGLLIAVGSALEDFCAARDAPRYAELVRAVGVLERRLNAGH